MFVFQGGYLGAVFMSMLVFPGITPVCWVLHGALPREMLVFSKDVLVCAQESSYAPLRCLGASGDAFLLHKGSWLPQEHSGCSPGFLAAQSRCSLGAQVDAWLLQEDTWVTFVCLPGVKHYFSREDSECSREMLVGPCEMFGCRVMLEGCGEMHWSFFMMCSLGFPGDV